MGLDPIPAVWLLLIVIAGAYAAWVRSLRPGRRRTGDPEVSADQIALFTAGLVVLGPPSTGRSARSPPATWRARTRCRTC